MTNSISASYTSEAELYGDSASNSVLNDLELVSQQLTQGGSTGQVAQQSAESPENPSHLARFIHASLGQQCTVVDTVT